MKTRLSNKQFVGSVLNGLVITVFKFFQKTDKKKFIREVGEKRIKRWELFLTSLPFRKRLIIIIIISTKYKMPKCLKWVQYRIRVKLYNCIIKRGIAKTLKCQYWRDCQSFLILHSARMELHYRLNALLWQLHFFSFFVKISCDDSLQSF